LVLAAWSPHQDACALRAALLSGRRRLYDYTVPRLRHGTAGRKCADRAGRGGI